MHKGSGEKVSLYVYEEMEKDMNNRQESRNVINIYNIFIYFFYMLRYSVGIETIL